jgi:hypothetical protein
VAPAALAASILAGSCAPGAGSRVSPEAAAQEGPSKKRAGPAAVKPVTRDGIRYEAIVWGKTRGLGQNGGYIAAVEESTGREIWVLRVYEIKYDADMEPDKQDIFITSLLFGSPPDRLLVEDEKGRRYSVDLKTRTVSPAPATARDR